MNPANKSWAEQTKDFVDYYSFLADQKGIGWMLGLYVAKNWMRLVRDERPNLEEAKLMVIVLEAERANQGVAWSDMFFRVKNWIAEVEKAQEEKAS